MEQGLVVHVSRLWGNIIVQRDNGTCAVFWPFKGQTEPGLGDLLQWAPLTQQRTKLTNAATKAELHVQTLNASCVLAVAKTIASQDSGFN